ncbi:MAG: beta-N-acetylhexosaminidase [Ferrovum sp.]|nr:beta-N-acetylhexosaminidase [Ferrovum sp.]
MTNGPVMLDVAGLEIQPEERELLTHPATGGVILFTRNYESPVQLQRLTQALRQINPDLVVAVDHEGGRVQRFREGFTPIPAMGLLGQEADRDGAAAERWAEACGEVMAWELAQRGVDFSFTPVLDLDYGHSTIIGNRAFHRQPPVVSRLAQALCRGLQAQGMAAVAKHFPGHGFVEVDSHLGLPTDERSLEQLEHEDLVPFAALIRSGVTAIMPGHLLFPQVAPEPAGFSPFWLTTVLRHKMGFSGMIVSDDLTMGGAARCRSIEARAHQALAAGCDGVLVCNDSAAAGRVLTALETFSESPQPRVPWRVLRQRAEKLSAERYQDAVRVLQQQGA